MLILIGLCMLVNSSHYSNRTFDVKSSPFTGPVCEVFDEATYYVKIARSNGNVRNSTEIVIIKISRLDCYLNYVLNGEEPIYDVNEKLILERGEKEVGFTFHLDEPGLYVVEFINFTIFKNCVVELSLIGVDWSRAKHGMLLIIIGVIVLSITAIRDRLLKSKNHYSNDAMNSADV